MEEYTLTAATWFWLLVPMPLLVVWAIISYFKEKKEEEEYDRQFKGGNQ